MVMSAAVLAQLEVACRAFGMASLVGTAGFSCATAALAGAQEADLSIGAGGLCTTGLVCSPTSTTRARHTYPYIVTPTSQAAGPVELSTFDAGALIACDGGITHVTGAAGLSQVATVRALVDVRADLVE